jgi:proteic killer suppression protein
MQIEYAETWLEQLANNIPINTRFSQAVIRAYQRKVDFIIAAGDERTLRATRGMQFKELKGMGGLYSIRVNDQFRIISQFAKRPLEMLSTFKI